MTQKKPNQYNNPIVQALLDTKKLLWDEDIQLDNIDDIIEEFENNEHLRESATRLWTSHKIPDKSVRFIMSLVYNCCPERFELPRDEQLIRYTLTYSEGTLSIYAAFSRLKHLVVQIAQMSF